MGGTPDYESGVLVVLSADERWGIRIAQHFETWCGLRMHCVTDPAALPRELRVSPLTYAAATLIRRPIGLVVDLTLPWDGGLRLGLTYQAAQGDRVTAWSMPHADAPPLAWCLAALLAALPILPYLPLVVVSAEPQVGAIFRHHGALCVEQVSPIAEEVVWQRIIAHMVDVARRVVPSTSDTAHEQPGPPPTSVLPLPGGGWVDLHRCLVRTEQQTLQLTGREVRVLEVLAEAPGRFHTVSELARRATLSQLDYPDEHCIEQTIYGLRRKLGESARAPQALLSRRGLGYAFMVEPAEALVDAERRTVFAGQF